MDKLESIGEAFSIPLHIPNNGLLASPDEFYPILLEAAIEARVNIFRTNIDYSVQDTVQVHKYVLLTNTTQLFSSLRLTSGAFLTAEDTQRSSRFLSNIDSREQHQAGILSTFGNGYIFEIKPLQFAYTRLPVEGQYLVESSEEQYNHFIDLIVQKVNKRYDGTTLLTPEDFKHSSDPTGEIEMKDEFLSYIHSIILIITMMMLIYYVFNESKRIGIMKMHGLSNIILWYFIIGRLISVMFALAVVASVIASLFITNVTVSFIGHVVVSAFISYIIISLISLVAYVHISRIRVVDAIKNRKETNRIFAWNTLLKTGASLVLILVILSIWDQYDHLHIKQHNMKSWERSKDYGMFYPLTVGDDLEDVKHGAYKMTVAQVTGLYPLLNQAGALYINAGDYEQRSLLLNRDNLRSIKVNLNYLNEFPVYDTQGQPVQLSEDRSDAILLVPDKYRAHEQTILDTFKKKRKSRIEGDEFLFKVPVTDRMKNQQLNIIWIANGQNLFSFNTEVFPSENNIIVDPIIEVITEQNSLVADKANMMSGGGRDPLKVKLIDRDTQKTYEFWEPELKRLKLNDNSRNLITVDQYILKQIHDLQLMMNQLLFISVGLTAGLLVLVIQNLSIFFSKYKRRFMIRRLFGSGFFQTYKEYMWVLAATWVIQIGACFLVNNGFASTLLQKAGGTFAVASSIYEAVGASDISILAIGSGVIAVEFIAAVLGLYVLERSNKVNILKGGH